MNQLVDLDQLQDTIQQQAQNKDQTSIQLPASVKPLLSRVSLFMDRNRISDLS